MAEIEWRETDTKSYFCVLARADQDEPGIVLAESPPLAWPPTSASSVQVLAAAARKLETSLAASGWKALGPGSQWYAKRFSWEPVVGELSDSPAAQQHGSNGFARHPSWPEDTRELWRCEIERDADSVPLDGCLARTMSVSLSLPRLPRRAPVVALGVSLAVTVGALLLLALPGSLLVGIGLVAVLPVGSLIVAGGLRAATVAGALAYASVLAWAHSNHFVVLFGYQGLIDAGPEPAAVLAATALAALPAAWLPLSADRPSTAAVWCLYIVAYVPAVMVPLFLTADLRAVLPYDVALLGGLAILSVVRTFPLVPSMARRAMDLTTFTRLLCVLGLASAAYVATTYGVALPTFAEVYEVRNDFNSGAGWPAGYLIPWAGGVINPFLMAVGLMRKRADVFLLGLSGQLLIYGANGGKSGLFSIALIPLVFAAIAVFKRGYGLVVVTMTPVIVALGILVSPLTNDWSLSLVRREFGTTGQISWYYYQYFSERPHYNLSQSFLNGITSSPYSIEPPDLIGQVFFSPENPHANTNVWGDAFANFGFEGVIVFTVLLGAVFWALDVLGRGRDPRVLGSVLVVSGLGLAEGALFTSLLTRGLALAAVLIYLMPATTSTQEDAT